MRPVELIPEGERRGRLAAMRTGPLPFVIVGALAALLIGVALLVTTSNEISEDKAEIATLSREKDAAAAQAEALRPYVEFLQMERQRVSTVAELADGRFDWVRTIHELALIIPRNVWLTELAASAEPGASGSSGGSIGGESKLTGPALDLTGCATGQDAVAGFIAAAKQIDGVTRVGLGDSTLPKLGTGSSGGGQSGACAGRVASFSAVIAFDDAPLSPDDSSAPESEGAAGTTGTEGATAAGGETGGAESGSSETS